MPGSGRSDQSCIARQSWLTKPVVVRNESTVKMLPQIACIAAARLSCRSISAAPTKLRRKSTAVTPSTEISISWICGSESRGPTGAAASRLKPRCETAGSRKTRDRDLAEAPRPAAVDAADRRDAAGRERRHRVAERDEGAVAGEDEDEREAAGQAGIDRRDRPEARAGCARLASSIVPLRPRLAAGGAGLADLEAAEVQRREDGEGGDEHHQPAHPADQRRQRCSGSATAAAAGRTAWRRWWSGRTSISK